MNPWSWLLCGVVWVAHARSLPRLHIVVGNVASSSTVVLLLPLRSHTNAWDGFNAVPGHRQLASLGAQQLATARHAPMRCCQTSGAAAGCARSDTVLPLRHCQQRPTACGHSAVHGEGLCCLGHLCGRGRPTRTPSAGSDLCSACTAARKLVHARSRTAEPKPAWRLHATWSANQLRATSSRLATKFAHCSC